MYASPSVLRQALGTACLLLVMPATSAAQLIALKTVPVAAGDQFLIFPSQHLGMGSVSIAVDDTLLDPFANPAKTARLAGPYVFATPTFYSISNGAGSARTLPAGALFAGDRWFGGAAVALQQLEAQEFFGARPALDILPGPPDALSERMAANKYGVFVLGSRLPAGVTLAGSVFFSDLRALDGVEHLYAAAADIHQAGSMTDLRLGMTKAFDGGRVLDAVVLHNRFDMDHDVTYVDFVLTDPVNRVWESRLREEHNRDVTRTWGLHVGYVQPIGTDGWRVGGTFTANRKSHPKIPNYELMSIPKDPGHSTAFDLGIGFARMVKNTTFGIDIVVEPAFSDTWAEAEAPVETASGRIIPAGGKTIENSFRFSNAFVRLGVAETVGPAGFQFGLQVRAYDYHLDQWDNVAETTRRQDEQWMEWTPTWGASVRFAQLELRYQGRVTSGTGRPGVAWNGRAERAVADAALASDILLAPSGPLTLQDATVLTHQVSLSVPIK